MKRPSIVIAPLSIVASARAVEPAAIDATTAGVDRMRLWPNGRREYLDADQAEAQKAVVAAYDKQHDDAKVAEQGGLFGIGRRIGLADPDDRGSLGAKH